MSKNNAKLKRRLKLQREYFKRREIEFARNEASLKYQTTKAQETKRMYKKLYKHNLNETIKKDHIIDGLADAANRIWNKKQHKINTLKNDIELIEGSHDYWMDEALSFQKAGFFKRLKYLFTGRL